MSRYHKATHRANEYPSIVNWNDAHHTRDITEVDRKSNSTEKALANSKTTKDYWKTKNEGPKKVVHVNVSKASPDIQKTVKKLKKTGKDTYVYKKK